MEEEKREPPPNHHSQHGPNQKSKTQKWQESFNQNGSARTLPPKQPDKGHSLCKIARATNYHTPGL
jgi:hypothetical protein